MKTPCIIIMRDRISHLRLCIASLEESGAELDIHIVDHGTTWEEALPFLNGSRYPVHFRGDQPPRSLWEWTGLAEIVGDRPYLVTDPDVILDPDCPDDWLSQLADHLTHGALVKAGLGLRLDDLPPTPLAAKAREWEQYFWAERAPEQAWRAPVDTTLALYPPLSRQSGFALSPAVRLDAPYLLRHLPWYGDLDPGETDYYRAHALPGTSHWINGGW